MVVTIKDLLKNLVAVNLNGCPGELVQSANFYDYFDKPDLDGSYDAEDHKVTVTDKNVRVESIVLTPNLCHSAT
jgi:hypothetical protein